VRNTSSFSFSFHDLEAFHENLMVVFCEAAEEDEDEGGLHTKQNFGDIKY
jgi:hypothetical protein